MFVILMLRIVVYSFIWGIVLLLLGVSFFFLSRKLSVGFELIGLKSCRYVIVLIVFLDVL